MPDSPTIGTPKGAVFLSYASQDAVAAERVCQCLRAAGIEVWFDQRELRGGDAWDTKIKRQIRNCALFVPFISAHTQERSEGYFRREWNLATQRLLDMAHDAVFIVPVVIDGTRDSEARVPDEFLRVQWTRIPEGDAPAAFGEHVRALLGGPAVERAHGTPASGRPASRPLRSSRPWVILAAAGGIAIAGLALWQPWHRETKQSVTPPAPATSSEAEQLVARVWEQLNKTELGPEELEIADGLCKRAAEIAPDDAAVWAAWSQVESWYVYHNFDGSSVRQEAARSNAARALKLAPDSFEARLAQACYLVRGATGGTGLGQVSTFAQEAEQLLRRLLQERPDEPRALFALAILERNLRHIDQAREGFDRLARNPKFAATALSERAWLEYLTGAYSEVDAPLDRSLALQEFYGNLGLKVIFSLRWRGDPASARAAMDKLPASIMQSDYGASTAFDVLYMQRKPDEWLKFVQGFPRDWMHSNNADGPVAYFNGLMLQMAGRHGAARLEWEAALRQVEQRLAEQPTSANLLWDRAEMLLRLDRLAEAEKCMQLAAELSGTQVWGKLMFLNFLQGKTEAALDLLETRVSVGLTAADLRLEPSLDPYRENPRFKALLARFEADPKKSPTAPRGPVPAPTTAGRSS
jgi:tetratricopeptide (TPR) repeat protein